MKISVFAVGAFLMVILVGCFPYKPQTLWFNADPPQANSPRTFRIEISYMLVDARHDLENHEYVLEMAEFWARRQAKLCLHGITPIDCGYDQTKRRYWMTASCKPEAAAVVK